MNISDLKLFIQVAETNSFSAAAREMNISSAVASAGIKRLEKELGVMLFIRSTRKLRLSASGKLYLHYCKRAIDELRTGSEMIFKEKDLIAGQMNLSLPSDLGRNYLLTCLEDFTTTNPLLTLMISIDDQVSDFYDDNVDIAIRYGQLDNSTLIAFRLATTERILCASPSYIKKYGKLLHPNDLTKHNCLLFKLENRIFDLWTFNFKGKKQSIHVKGNKIANDADIVRRWALSGQGVALKSRLDINQEINDGRLVHLLPDCQFPPLDIWLICPSRSLLSPAVIALKNNLKQRLQDYLTLTAPFYG